MNEVQPTTADGDHEGFNRRQALGLAGAAAVGAVGAGAVSAPAAAAAGRSDDVTHMASVSLALAQEIVEAAVDYVEANDLPKMFIVVVDAAGDEKASARMDGNGSASTVLVPIKARTAAAFRRSTAELATSVTNPAAVASFTTAGFSMLGGGVPIVVDDMVVGAVGVGGGSAEQDDEVAKAAIEAALG